MRPMDCFPQEQCRTALLMGLGQVWLSLSEPPMHPVHSARMRRYLWPPFAPRGRSPSNNLSEQLGEAC